MFLGFNHSPYPKETGRCQKFIGTFYMHAHGMRNGLHGDQTILEKKLQGRPRHLLWPKFFGQEC